MLIQQMSLLLQSSNWSNLFDFVSHRLCDDVTINSHKSDDNFSSQNGVYFWPNVNVVRI